MDAKDFIATWGPDGTAGYCFEPGITKTDSASAHRRLGRRVAARLFCVGEQGARQIAGRGAQAVDAVRTAAGERAAAGGV